MAWTVKFLLLPLSLLVIANGCSFFPPPTQEISFYTLEYEVQKTPPPEPLPVAIKLERFGAAPEYNSSRIVYRDDAYQRSPYVYHKWQAKVGDIVYYSLTRDFARSGFFKAVFTDEIRFPASYRIGGFVNEFGEWDREPVWMAVNVVNIILFAEGEPDARKRILFQKTYRAEVPLNGKNPSALAEAMSQAMAQVSSEIIEDVYNAIKKSEKL
jgi:cholesterol transport system auxiliary component